MTVYQSNLNTMNPNQQQTGRQQALAEMSGHQQPANDLIGYYFGSISRETAEWILRTHANQLDGAYILRSSGPNDDFVLSLMVVHNGLTEANPTGLNQSLQISEVLHYKIVETEDSFVALHGQVGDEKFATIDELIDKAQGVATKPRWPILRHTLESQILPPTYWGLTVDQVRLAILIKAKQWGFPLLSSLFQPSQQQQQQQIKVDQSANCCPPSQQQNLIQQSSVVEGANAITTLSNETIRTLIYKSLHEFQPWFHGKISREEAERRVERVSPKDGRFLVRERDNYSYAMCISHKRTTKHYRIDVLPTGELAIQDGRKFTSLMALVSHYTIMSDGLWCALTEACPRPIQTNRGLESSALSSNQGNNPTVHNCNNLTLMNQHNLIPSQNLYCISAGPNSLNTAVAGPPVAKSEPAMNPSSQNGCLAGPKIQPNQVLCPHQYNAVTTIKAPIKEWLQTINQKWSQLMSSRNQHQSLNSFLFGSQNPLNNHCRHNNPRNQQTNHRRKCKNGHTSCACISQSNYLALQRSLPIHNGSNQQLPPRMRDIDLRYNNSRCNDQTLTKVPSCYVGTNCPTIAENTNHAFVPTGFVPQNNNLFKSPAQKQQGPDCLSANMFLPCLPQSSGFAVNAQSFVGSPLFAVDPAKSIQNSARNNHSGSSSSGSGSGKGNNIGEAKLISPAQSISANLNDPYALHTDIYGSQTSTAIVNDQLPTSSSSSSGTMALQRGFSGLNQPAQHQSSQTNTKVISNNGQQLGVHHQQQQQQASINRAGQIMCGQHAGPAYRYSNCNDVSSLKPCFHRPLASHRACDDSQLVNSSTQVAGPAAMAKFVQFQDGQCLRTHRDTRSIQLAYLSSRQAFSGNSSRNASKNDQVPQRFCPSTLNGVGQRNGPQLAPAAIMDNANFNHDRRVFSPQDQGYQLNKFCGSACPPFGAEKHDDRVNLNNGGNLTEATGVDLMDCGEDVAFDFKYDPRLIKSSSIETLCGANEDEHNMDDFANFKSNTELMMSLQPHWLSDQKGAILSPIQTMDRDNKCDQQTLHLLEADKQAADPKDSTILASLMVESRDEEGLDKMRKRHDLDELTTALLAELTASLKAQVDLKNKRSGFGLHSMEKLESSSQRDANQEQAGIGGASAEANPLELVNEFDTLIPNNRL